MHYDKQAVRKIVLQAGGAAAVGSALGITGQAVSQWQIIPHNHVLMIERLSRIPRWKLRPDLYPAPHKRNGKRP